MTIDKATGYIWCADVNGNNITRFDPKTEPFVEYPIPSADAVPRFIDVDSGTGKVWFTEFFTGKIGVLDPGDSVRQVASTHQTRFAALSTLSLTMTACTGYVHLYRSSLTRRSCGVRRQAFQMKIASGHLDFRQTAGVQDVVFLNDVASIEQIRGQGINFVRAQRFSSNSNVGGIPRHGAVDVAP